MMMSRVTELIRRVKYILQTEGLVPLLKRGLPSVTGCFFKYETYYVSEQTLQESKEADYMPKVQDFVHKIVTSNGEVNELTTEDFEFRPWHPVYRRRLDDGAVALCIFVERQLANILWVAMTQQAKDSLNEPPYKVDFSKGETCAGDTWTSPKYRRMGLTRYNQFKRVQLQLENGMVICRGATIKRKTAGRMAAVKFGMRIYAEARYLRVLWWKWWKEKPLS